MAKKIDFGKIAINVAGNIGGVVVAEAAGAKFLPTMNPLLRGAIKIAAGAFLPVLAPKMTILESAGNGMISSGGLDIGRKFMPTLFAPSGPATVEGIGAQIEESAVVEDSEFSTWLSGTETYGAGGGASANKR